jgi:PhnB protein
MSKQQPGQEQKQTVTPYLTCADASRALDFYKEVFGATELMRLAETDGKVGHAEFQIGNTRLMLSDEYPEFDARGPLSLGGTSFGIHILVDDADAVFNKAIAAGATQLKPVKDEFYGERSGKVRDPFGHIWYISSTIENLSDEEVTRRFEESSKQ